MALNAVVDNTIPQSDTSVNSQYMQKNKKDTQGKDGEAKFQYSYEALTSKPDMTVTKIDDQVRYRPDKADRKELRLIEPFIMQNK